MFNFIAKTLNIQVIITLSATLLRKTFFDPEVSAASRLSFSVGLNVNIAFDTLGFDDDDVTKNFVIDEPVVRIVEKDPDHVVGQSEPENGEQPTKTNCFHILFCLQSAFTETKHN